MYKRRLFTSVLMLGLAVTALALFSGSAMAGKKPVIFGAGNTQSLVCIELGHRFSHNKDKHNFRHLNEMLFEAADKGCLETAKKLIKAGASIKARDRFGNTPLLVAAMSGENEMLQYLLSLGSDVNHLNLAQSSALLRAVKANRRKTVRLLLKAGANIQTANKQGLTPLLASVFNGDSRMFKRLLDAGADVSVVDKSGKGAILYAAAKGYTAIVRQLLDAGVNVNRSFGHKLTALMWAAGHTNDVPEKEGLNTLNLLLEHGALVNNRDDRGRTALMIAASRGHDKIVTRLRKAGASLTVRDKSGKTALDLAGNEQVRLALAE